MKEKKLNIFLLIALIVGTIIGGGIFNSPTDLIMKANPLASLIAWVIGGFGILMLVLVFYKLSVLKPELTGGIYTYSKAGFGNYMGFNSFWGYWLGSIFGNIAFITLFFKALNSMLGPHALSSLWCFIGGSAILWIYTLIAWLGTQEASILNAVVTILKIIPLFLVIIIGIFTFDFNKLNVPNWTSVLIVNHHFSSLGTQINDAMSTIVWCFVGIEATVTMSRRAKKPNDVGIATVVSFLIVLILYMLVSIFPMGIATPKELSHSLVPLVTVFKQNQFAYLGSLIIKIGLLISLLGALLSWFIIGPEIAYVTSIDNNLPKKFKKLNKHKVPSYALLVYTLIMQFFLLLLLLPQLQSAYTVAYTLATSMTLVSYLLSAMYGAKVAYHQKKDYWFKLFASLAVIYTIYMLIAAGIEYVFASTILFGLGIPLYLASPGKLTNKEKFVASGIVAIGSIAMIFIVQGYIHL